MTMQEFVKLSYVEKDEEVYLNGKFLINYDEENEMFDVYELDNFTYNINLLHP